MTYFDYFKYDTESFESARDYFLGVLEDVYTTGNVDNLERHLDELCAFFEMTIPKGDPVICKKPTKQEDQTTRMLQSWVGYTRAYAEMACGSKRKEKAQ